MHRGTAAGVAHPEDILPQTPATTARPSQCAHDSEQQPGRSQSPSQQQQQQQHVFVSEKSDKQSGKTDARGTKEGSLVAVPSGSLPFKAPPKSARGAAPAKYSGAHFCMN